MVKIRSLCSNGFRNVWKHAKLAHLNKFYHAHFLHTLILIHFPLFHRDHRMQIRRWSNQNLICATVENEKIRFAQRTVSYPISKFVFKLPFFILQLKNFFDKTKNHQNKCKKTYFWQPLLVSHIVTPCGVIRHPP